MIATFAKAVALGLAVAAPVGPIGILCVRRTLADGRGVGLACGLGAATADTVYGLMAGLGLTAVSTLLVAYDAPIRILGALYLAVLGVITLRTPSADRAAGARPGSAWRAWASTFLLTITNPMTIVSFAAMFSTLGIARDGGRAAQAIVITGGVFVGSALWWLALSATVARFRARVRPHHLTWVNRGAGAMLIGFAAWAAASAG